MFPIDIGLRSYAQQALELRRDVFRLANELGSMKEPLTKSVHDVVIKSISQNFLFGGRPKWAKLSESRVAARRSATPILMDKQALYRAAVSKTTWRITDTEANMERLDKKVKYAKFHQTGTSKMPMREFAVLQAKDIDDITEIFHEWLGRMTIQYGKWPST